MVYSMRRDTIVKAFYSFSVQQINIKGHFYTVEKEKGTKNRGRAPKAFKNNVYLRQYIFLVRLTPPPSPHHIHLYIYPSTYYSYICPI